MDRLGDVFAGEKQINADVLDELENALYTADIGVKTTEEILESIRERVDRKLIGDTAELKGLIGQHILEVLEASERPVPQVDQPPAVVMVVGVNGSGKTTTIGKLASRFKSEGRSVLLCAADTFRAAAIEQLEIWGERTDIKVIRQSQGSDPSAVLFDALQSRQSKQGGPCHCRHRGPPAHQIEPHGRAREDEADGCEGDPHGAPRCTPGPRRDHRAKRSGAGAQVHRDEWCDRHRIDQLDGTAKGGIVVAIARELNLPIRYVGVGEKADDLLPFDPQEFVASIFEP